MAFSNGRVGFDLQTYFEDNVQISRDERKRSLKVVGKIVDRITEIISDADERFSRSLIHVGSHYQGLKTGKTDEFDMNVQVVGVENVRWGDGDPSITYGFEEFEDDKKANDTSRQGLHIVEKRRRMSPSTSCGTLRVSDVTAARFKDMTYNGDLVPYLVKQTFLQLIANACEEMQGVRLMQQPHGPALTIVISGEDHRGLAHDVHVDFAPTIRAQLPLQRSFNWPRSSMYNWPPKELIESIKLKRVNLVCKKNFFWTFSFAEMEKELSLHADQPGDCRKKVHRIMKVLFKNQWCHGPGLSSYHLKNAWLWYCEVNQDQWSEKFIGSRFVGCAQYFMNCLLQQRLPQYFNITNNLLDGKDKSTLTGTAHNIGDFLNKHSFC